MLTGARFVLQYSLTLCLVALLAGCAGLSARDDASLAVEFMIVRHAEKVDDRSDDPPLTEAGRARARLLADLLRPQPLGAVYATSFQRTRQTATPAAREHGLRVTSYDATQSTSEFSARLRRMHPTGVVLVVGHSNTVPSLVAALCACEVAPMAEHEYDRLSIVRIDAGDRARLQEQRY